MRKLKFFFMAALSALILGACSEDKFPDGPGTDVPNPDTEDGVYVALNIEMPTGRAGSRSYTDGDGGSNTGIEIGKDYENNVNEAIVVLTNRKYSFIGAATITEKTATTSGNNQAYVTLSKFNKTQLAAYYEHGAEEGTSIDEVYVFVFCNPNLGLTDFIFGNGTTEMPGVKLLDKEWINKIATLVTPASIWAKNQFLMSNYSLALRQIPATLEGWNPYNVESKPFNLSGTNEDGIDNSETNSRGTVKVERSAARFDFRDGSIDGKTDPNLNGIGDNTYVVITDDDDAKTPLIQVQLKKMSLVNMNKQFYFLRRVSDNGTNTQTDNGWMLCGAEKPWFTAENGSLVMNQTGNFVVDADQAWKSTMPKGGFNTHFNYPFFNEDGSINNNELATTDRWATYVIDDVLGKESDTDNTWNNGQTHPEYHIWRYATENTIAPIVGSDNAFSWGSQVNGISTGVVFKARMIATEKALQSTDASMKELAQTLNSETLTGTYDDPILYNFHNRLFVTWENVRKQALTDAIEDIHWVGSEDEGHFEYDINREIAFYTAVFGDGGFGTIEIEYTNPGSGVKPSGKYPITDDRPVDSDCANSLWQAWNAAGKPNDDMLTAFKKKATEEDFALYQSTNDPVFGNGYYCYYYYWNRHNDNGQNGIMGPMEFCVVRNNVYKLAVTKIKQLGHPRLSENDPDKPTPDTPDESEDVYISVTCEVLPWVVRLNNIEF